MTQHVLIGVGGSGQHVVHAYLRLLTLGFVQAVQVPHVFVLDADARLGEGRDKRSTLIDDIFRLHSFLVSGDRAPSRCAVLKPYRESPSGDPASLLLGKLLGIADNSPAVNLAHGFLADDAEAWANDWNVELVQGMMANPKVGSIALAHKFEGLQGRDIDAAHSNATRKFAQLFAAMGNGTRVAIVGSNFGGTGSGAIPALVRQLSSRPGVEAVRAFMSLPWFSIEDGEVGGKAASAARRRDGVDPTVRNSTLGLHTYLDELVDSSAARRFAYVLCQSMAGWPIERRRDDGNYDQTENRHVINLVQAGAIQAFLNLGAASAPNGALYSMRATAPAESQGRFDAGSSPHMRFWVRTDDSRQLVDLVADAEATAFALEKGGRVLQTATDGKLRLDGVAELRAQPGLDRFAIQLSTELGKGTVRRGWLPLGSFQREAAPDEIFVGLGEALVELAEQLRASLVWLDGHYVERAGTDADSVSGVTDCGAAHLFNVQSGGDSAGAFVTVDDNASLRRPWARLGLQVTNLEKQDLGRAEPVSQAFAMFTKAFAHLPQAVDPVTALISEFSEMQRELPEQSVFRIAARVIGKAVHKLVMEARNTVRKKDNLADAQQSGGLADDNTSPMLDLQGIVGTPVADARLVQVNLHEPMMEDADAFHPNHPLSLAYIDPYIGLRLHNGNRLSFGSHCFAEHGLRGIPNIAAPRLLQKWRIEKCRPGMKADAPLFTPRDGRVHATKEGVYAHARRINEAAFWLIVSADARVTFVNDLFNERNEETAFARLLRKELRLAPTEHLAALVFAATSPDAGKPIFMWSGETWYLAANTAARNFLAALVGELPSVRHRYRPDNPLLRADLANERSIKSLDRFFAQQIANAVRQIDASRLVPDPAALTPAATLRAVLNDIQAELPAPATQLDGRRESDVTSLWVRSSDNPHAAINLQSPKAIARLNEYFCERPVIFVDHEQRPNGVLPLRAEAWSMLQGGVDKNKLVLAPSGQPKVDGHILAVRKVQQMQLSIAGVGEMQFDFPFGARPLPVIEEELAWSVALWPNFRAEGWNYYVISGTARLGDPSSVEADEKTKAWVVDTEWLNESMEVALVVKGRRRGQGDEMCVLARLTDGLHKRIDGVPEVLELVVGGRVLGSRPIVLEEAPRAGTVHMLGIDFGTSNTCVAVQIQQNQQNQQKLSPTIPLLPGGQFDDARVDPMLYYIDSSAQPRLQGKFLSSVAAFFHVKNEPLQGELLQDKSGETIPSELLVSLDEGAGCAKLQKERLTQVYGAEDKPFGDFSSGPPLSDRYPFVSPLLTPLAPQPYGLKEDKDFFAWLRTVVGADGQRLYGDLKWPRGEDDRKIRESRALRALYLEHVLVTAMAVLRSKGYAGFEKFVATQPEALSQVRNEFANTFGRDLNALMAALVERTGMSWANSMGQQERQALLVSETVAALYLVGEGDELSTASVLTIDIGGGTTDVGVSLRYGTSSGKLSQCHTLSARFAGNKLLEAMARSPFVRAHFEDQSQEPENYSVDALKSLLKSELRRKGELGMSNDFTGHLADMFFDGVYEYAFNALSMFMQLHPDWVTQFVADPKQKLRVVQLGNGFRLYEACQAPGNRATQTLHKYNEKLRRRLVDVGLLSREIAEKLEFSPAASSRSGLISVGGFNAVTAGALFKEEQAEVLLPRGLVAIDGNRISATLPEPRLIPLEEFRAQWLGMSLTGRMAERRLSLDSSQAEPRRMFPLTHLYWTDKGGSRELQNIFHSSPNFASLYMDVGALYLTGMPLDGGRSFGWLLAEFAREMQ